MRAKFSSKIGIIAATVGSAVGLGNIWRFPAEVQENGGAAFLLIYVLCVFMLGIPVMLAEFALGRAGGSDAVGTFKKLSPRTKWWLTGLTGVIASYMILCFYMVVAGWTLEYLVQSITGNLYQPIGGNDAAATFTSRMQQYIQGDISPLIYTYVMIGLNLFILIAGVRKGIERMSNLLMPTLFLLLIIFCCVSLSLPEASKGLEYFFNPDFSKITPSVFVNAMGQAFFSLSLGMGILITYAAYYPREAKLPKTAMTVSMLDLGVAILMGIIIFPAVLSFGLEGESLRGLTLVFVTLPEVFTHMEFTCMWSSLFFLALTVAALTSTISIAEVTIAMFEDRFKMPRLKACLAVLLPTLLFSTLCSSSLGEGSSLVICDKTLFDFLDIVATNILLPLCALSMCVYAGWIVPRKLMINQLTNDGVLNGNVARLAIFSIRYIAPPAIFVILVSGLL
ncbi:MAG: sodium-dependent transporter [Clostridiales bacterium]|nr:sodium-dependent transporter [Clostridiales bacterium]